MLTMGSRKINFLFVSVGLDPPVLQSIKFIILNFQITKSFQQKNHFLAIFFDISKAFDTTWKYKIIKTLPCGTLKKTP